MGRKGVAAGCMSTALVGTGEPGGLGLQGQLLGCGVS